MKSARLVSPETYLALDLHAHGVLAGIPLLDVWEVELPGGGAGRTLEEALEPLRNGEAMRASAFVRFLFALRGWLGRVFRLDDEPLEATTKRAPLTPVPPHLVEGSVPPTGSPEGPFIVLYGTERELAGEIKNATVHAFSVHALVKEPGGYRLFWAVYVKQVSALTPLYMALIAPFRHFFVYPTILGGIQRGWVARARTS